MNKKFDYHELLGSNNPLIQYQQLFESALNEFSIKKYEDASLNDILKNANMSKGSFYHHFGDKFGLYLSLNDIIIKRKITFFTPLLEQYNQSKNIFDAIRLVSKSTMDFMFQDHRLYDFSNRYLEADLEFKSKILKYFPYDFNQGFGKLIEYSIASNQIDPIYSKEFVTKILEILFTNVNKLVSPKHTPEQVYDIINQIVNLMQSGIANKKEE